MQTSIYLMIGVGKALFERKLEGNTYQLQTRLQLGEVIDQADRTAIRVSAVGIHRPDGSIADDVTLNWIVGSVLGLALARPIPFQLPEGATDNLPDVGEPGSEVRSQAQLFALLENLEKSFDIKSDTPIEGFPASIDGQPMSIEEVIMGGHLPPALLDITGQAVDDAVIFPAQYGSPDVHTDGWYWSATVDTNKVGLHRCDLHIQLFRPRIEGSTVTWDPEVHVLEMELDVSQLTQVNGFTGAGMGYLPFIEPMGVEVEHV